MSGMGSRIFFRTSLVPSITYILPIKIGWVVFEKIWFSDFSKFVYNFCKKFFFELILGVNSSFSGSHLPSQNGSNPSGGTQTMLILLRPFTKNLDEHFINNLNKNFTVKFRWKIYLSNLDEKFTCKILIKILLRMWMKILLKIWIKILLRIRIKILLRILIKILLKIWIKILLRIRIKI